MKKYISVMLAVVLLLLMYTQAYCIQINEEKDNDVQKSVAAYLHPKTDATTVVNNKLKLIYGLKQGITKSELLNQYIEANDGVDIVVSNKIGTGVKLNVYDSSSGDKIDTYTILIIGDVDGDGYYNGIDSVIVKCLSNSLLSKNLLKEEFLLAADCNKDGQIDGSDSESLENAGLFLEDIDQTFIYENPANKYTVTFVDYDGTTVLASDEVYEGSVANLPSSPSKPGTAFLGWSGNYTNVNNNETVRAVYKDSKNVFMISSETGNIGDTVTVLVSVDGSVNICGFDFTIMYDPALELISYDEDLDLDVVANANKLTNGIILNSSANSNKTKQRDIIEMTFRITDNSKPALPINIIMTSAKEISGNLILDTQYTIVNGVVYVNG